MVPPRRLSMIDCWTSKFKSVSVCVIGTALKVITAQLPGHSFLVFGPLWWWKARPNCVSIAVIYRAVIMCQQHTKHLYVLSSQQLYQAVTVMNMPIIQMRKPRHSEWLFQGWGCATWLQSWCLLPPRPAAGMGRWPKAHSMTYPSATSVYIFTLHRKMKLECECIERRGGREIEQICSLTIKSYFNPVKDKKNQRNQRTKHQILYTWSTQ